MDGPTSYDRGRLDGQILQELKNMNGHLASLEKILNRHDTRIRVLENWRWWVVGAAGVAGIGSVKFANAMINTFMK